MKKLFLLGIFLFVLVGCGHKTQPITEKPAEEVKKEVPAKKEVVKEEIKKDEVKQETKNVSTEEMFKNDKYGFSFNYSMNYEKFENDEEQPGNVVYTLHLGEEFKGILVQVAKSTSLMAPNGMDPISTKDVTVSGKKAKLFEGGDSQVYAVVNGDYEYFIILENKNVDKKVKDDFVKIVNSFKFTK